MSNINEYSNDYEIFKTHYNGLSELIEAINLEISTLTTNEQSTSSIRKLLKLREIINDALIFCGVRHSRLSPVMQTLTRSLFLLKF